MKGDSTRRKAATEIEKHNIDDRIQHWVHPNDQLTISPTLFLDLGLLSNSATFVPTGGIYFAWHRAIVPHNELRVHASTGGTIRFGSPVTVSAVPTSADCAASPGTGPLVPAATCSAAESASPAATMSVAHTVVAMGSTPSG